MDEVYFFESGFTLIADKMRTLLILSLLSCSSMGQVADHVGADSAESKWPSNISPSLDQLKKLREEDLSADNKSESIHVRFIWVPTFHKPISIHVTKNTEGITLRYVKMSGSGGYDWGKIESEKTISLTSKNWNELVEAYLVKEARKPTDYLKKDHKKSFIEMSSGFDGSTWFLEVRDEKKYTVEGVPNPLNKDKIAHKSEEMGLNLEPFVATCDLLIKMAGVELESRY